MVDHQSKHKLLETSQWSRIVNLLTSSSITTTTKLISIIKEYNPSTRKENFNVLSTLLDDCYTPNERGSFFWTILPQNDQITCWMTKINSSTNSNSDLINHYFLVNNKYLHYFVMVSFVLFLIINKPNYKISYFPSKWLKLIN